MHLRGERAAFYVLLYIHHPTVFFTILYFVRYLPRAQAIHFMRAS